MKTAPDFGFPFGIRAVSFPYYLWPGDFLGLFCFGGIRFKFRGKVPGLVFNLGFFPIFFPGTGPFRVYSRPAGVKIGPAKRIVRV